MSILWTPEAWDEYLDWQDTDRRVVGRIHELIKEIRRTPFTGTGKPEPVKGEWAGWWSRRITNEHRLVYRVRGKGREQQLDIVQCRYHY